MHLVPLILVEGDDQFFQFGWKRIRAFTLELVRDSYYVQLSFSATHVNVFADKYIYDNGAHFVASLKYFGCCLLWLAKRTPAL